MKRKVTLSLPEEKEVNLKESVLSNESESPDHHHDMTSARSKKKSKINDTDNDSSFGFDDYRQQRQKFNLMIHDSTMMMI